VCVIAAAVGTGRCPSGARSFRSH